MRNERFTSTILLSTLLIWFSSFTFGYGQSLLYTNVQKISEYIAQDKFSIYLENENHLVLVDSIFSFALTVNNNDISETLLSLTFATVPYRQVPLKIPYLNIIFNFPLVSADKETYLKKNSNLPNNLFYDTPQNSFGDRDKLAHFFGSAFLSYNSILFDLTPFIGYFVEVFEETFKVESFIDERDLIVNSIGSSFGKALKDNIEMKPSYFIFNYSLQKMKLVPCLPY